MFLVQHLKTQGKNNLVQFFKFYNLKTILGKKLHLHTVFMVFNGCISETDVEPEIIEELPTTEEILDFTEPPMLPPIDFIEPPIPLPTPEKGNS